MNKRILLIVEGPNDEKVLVKKLWDRFDRNVDYTIVTYETNIYVLMKQLFRDGVFDKDVDLIRVLKSKDVPDNKRLNRNPRFLILHNVVPYF